MSLLRNWLHGRRVGRLVRAGIVPSGNRYLPGFGIRSNVVDPTRVSLGSGGVLAAELVFERPGHGRIRIGDRCHIGGNSKLISIEGIEIGDDVTIAWDCTLYDHDSHPLDWEHRRHDTPREYTDLSDSGDPIANKDWSRVRSSAIVVERRAWLGFGVTVLKGVRIGEGAVVGAMSVVTRDVPPYTVVAGNPARVVRTAPSQEGTSA
jgi:galactoside O-acetyltransferase